MECVVLPVILDQMAKMEILANLVKLALMVQQDSQVGLVKLEKPEIEGYLEDRENMGNRVHRDQTIFLATGNVTAVSFQCTGIIRV